MTDSQDGGFDLTNPGSILMFVVAGLTDLAALFSLVMFFVLMPVGILLFIGRFIGGVIVLVLFATGFPKPHIIPILVLLGATAIPLPGITIICTIVAVVFQKSKIAEFVAVQAVAIGAAALTAPAGGAGGLVVEGVEVAGEAGALGAEAAAGAARVGEVVVEAGETTAGRGAAEAARERLGKVPRKAAEEIAKGGMFGEEEGEEGEEPLTSEEEAERFAEEQIEEFGMPEEVVAPFGKIEKEAFPGERQVEITPGKDEEGATLDDETNEADLRKAA